MFVPVDCAALPDALLESELFGHERGAFTGADRTKPGMFEEADRGTLFLDEIGELPPALQSKLLRALQERQIRRVGGTKFVPVDVRLMSATNRDTAELVRKGEFRDDLFYRVNVITIALPPLRERAGDVACSRTSSCVGTGGTGAPAGRDRARRRSRASRRAAWPGNVRELQNVIERACALTDGRRIRVRDLADHVRGQGRGADDTREGPATRPDREA